LTLTVCYGLYYSVKKLAFLTPATLKPKGWSMKQSDKTPYSEKEDGVLFWGE
jgi:hypothetical protein